MKIPLTIEKTDRITLLSTVSCPNLRILAPIKFIVDTGSPYTFLGMDDVMRQSRLMQNLKLKEKAQMGGSSINILKIEHPTTLSFKDDANNLQRVVLSRFAVSDQTSLKQYAGSVAPSIIGIDFLRENGFDLFVSVKDNNAYLEK